MYSVHDTHIFILQITYIRNQILPHSDRQKKDENNHYERAKAYTFQQVNGMLYFLSSI